MVKPLVITERTNEEAVSYAHAGAAHTVRIIAQISPELLTLHQIQVTAFYKKTAAVTPVPGVSRDIKLLMFQDISQ